MYKIRDNAQTIKMAVSTLLQLLLTYIISYNVLAFNIILYYLLFIVLKDRRKAHLLNFMYIRKDRSELMNVRKIRTRAHDAPLFNVTILRYEAYKRSVGYFGSTEWNNLTVENRNIDLYLPFKYHMKQAMLEPLKAIS